MDGWERGMCTCVFFVDFDRAPPMQAITSRIREAAWLMLLVMFYSWLLVCWIDQQTLQREAGLAILGQVWALSSIVIQFPIDMLFGLTLSFVVMGHRVQQNLLEPNIFNNTR